ncbi:MAG: carbamoyl-phosphate synthase large subunit, partial [Rhodospirillaceae bacterium]|nr:carbamoyl-phosphate synthase large subunit [Rhodospirillaceae bacterium]
PTMGGQTALNTAMALHEDGTLDKYNVELIGAKPDAINMAEDRSLFRDAMTRIGLATPQAGIAHTMEEALEALAVVGLPAIIRPSFTLGGTGGGIAYNRDEFQAIITTGLDASPTNEVLVEESVLGWKEYEMEVVRDHADNCIIVCSIENVDPMGIHTGDSVTVAPALTLTDKEYQILRNASIACLREIGVDTGGSNVQFALNPEDGRLVVIEMNPRVSRSSALASKATGFPIAKVAARLAVGYTLDELDNDITGGVIPASFEPTIDYVVTKIPRFTFEKFPSTDALLTTSMKSVGEAMSVGRTFAESLQKALRSMETGLSGLDEIIIPGIEEDPVDAVRAALARPAPDRLLVVAQALRHGMARDEIERITRIDPWFVDQVADLIAIEDDLKSNGLPRDVRRMRGIKAQGFSDQRLAQLTGQSTAQVMAHRHDLDVHPVYKRIDTCAAEFESHTPYMYSTYEGVNQPVECEARPSDREKIIILGGGPNRIGQGIEFDYCCVHAVFALREAGYEAIMVNCNPETVSTDYDTSDRLYFEPLTAEDVLEIVRLEQSNGSLKGLIVQFGGQTPLKLAAELEAAGVPILGTTPDAIDLAEDRYRFQQLLQQLNLKQPPNGIATSTEEAHEIAARIGFPVVVRPSYVLGGRAMEIVRDESQLDRYMREAVKVSGESPVLVDGYLADAIEVDLDALCDGTDVVVAGIMEHIEEAGIHSGDSACSLPPYSLNADIVDEIRRQADALARGLSVVGLMNVQFAVRGDEIFILEVNPRASRTVPFVAKAIGAPIAKLAARIMAGEKLADFDLNPDQHDHVAVKEAVFPFARFPGVDVLLGPEMKSTGEVMGLDTTFAAAFAKSQIAAGTELPRSGKVFISVKDKDKPAAAELARNLCELGFTIIATSGTATYLKGQNIVVQSVNKVLEGRPHIVDEITNGEIALIFNTTEGAQAIADSFTLRRAALTHGIPYYTTISGAKSAMQAIGHLMQQGLDVAPLQSYF